MDQGYGQIYFIVKFIDIMLQLFYFIVCFDIYLCCGRNGVIKSKYVVQVNYVNFYVIFFDNGIGFILE